MSDTNYLTKYWAKCPNKTKTCFLTKQGLKDHIYSTCINEFSYSVFQYYGFEEMSYRLKKIGYTFSHKIN